MTISSMAMLPSGRMCGGPACGKINRAGNASRPARPRGPAPGSAERAEPVEHRAPQRRLGARSGRHADMPGGRLVHAPRPGCGGERAGAFGRHDAVPPGNGGEDRGDRARRDPPGPRPRATRRGRACCSPYQPARHSRATGAASGMPSFSQSSSATNSSASGLCCAMRAKPRYLRAIPVGSSAANIICSASTGSVPVAASAGSNRARLEATRFAPSASGA